VNFLKTMSTSAITTPIIALSSQGPWNEARRGWLAKVGVGIGLWDTVELELGSGPDEVELDATILEGSADGKFVAFAAVDS
jgi:hypothetical protein